MPWDGEWKNAFGFRGCRAVRSSIRRVFAGDREAPWDDWVQAHLERCVTCSQFLEEHDNIVYALYQTHDSSIGNRETLAPTKTISSPAPQPPESTIKPMPGGPRWARFREVFEPAVASFLRRRGVP